MELYNCLEFFAKIALLFRSRRREKIIVGCPGCWLAKFLSRDYGLGSTFQTVLIVKKPASTSRGPIE